MTASSISDLPLIESEEEARRVHRKHGLFFVKRGGAAHAAMDCIHLGSTSFVNNRAWRMATDAECRGFNIWWCPSCC
jgi:hypothetical protein